MNGSLPHPALHQCILCRANQYQKGERAGATNRRYPPSLTNKKTLWMCGHVRPRDTRPPRARQQFWCGTSSASGRREPHTAWPRECEEGGCSRKRDGVSPIFFEWRKWCGEEELHLLSFLLDQIALLCNANLPSGLEVSQLGPQKRHPRTIRTITIRMDYP